MFHKGIIFQIYDRLQVTVSWFQIKNHKRLIEELNSIRVVRSGSKVMPLLYDIYDIPREWDKSIQYPICDMV